jgi:predicted deacetylase
MEGTGAPPRFSRMRVELYGLRYGAKSSGGEDEVLQVGNRLCWRSRFRSTLLQKVTIPFPQQTVNQCARAKRFVVSIHDVAPSSTNEIAGMITALRPRVGTTITAAMIPDAFNRRRGAQLAALVRSSCQEIALHGYSHQGQSRYHPLSLLTQNALEFHGLSPMEVQRRLYLGQQILQEVFGRPASVFIPPAWCRGALTPAIAEGCHCLVIAGLMFLETRSMRCPLTVYSWDLGRFAVLGYAGEFFGHIVSRLRTAIPCVVLHPRDMSRNFFGRALAVIDRLIRNGFSPTTFSEIAVTPVQPLRNTLRQG